jgi:hypothetical protein
MAQGKTSGIHDVQMKYDKDTEELLIYLPGNSSDPEKIIRFGKGAINLLPVIGVDTNPDDPKLGFFQKSGAPVPQFGDISPDAVDLATALVKLNLVLAMLRGYALIQES